MAATEAPSYPEWWDWDEDGPSVAGDFVRAGKGYTRHGERAFVVLDVDGTERTVWLHEKVLQQNFAREVNRRPDKEIHVGERLEILRLDTRTSGLSGNEYRNFRVAFADSPEPSQAEIFGKADEPEVSSSETDVDGGGAADDALDGDGIPFSPV